MTISTFNPSTHLSRLEWTGIIGRLNLIFCRVLKYSLDALFINLVWNAPLTGSCFVLLIFSSFEFAWINSRAYKNIISVIYAGINDKENNMAIKGVILPMRWRRQLRITHCFSCLLLYLLKLVVFIYKCWHMLYSTQFYSVPTGWEYMCFGTINSAQRRCLACDYNYWSEGFELQSNCMWKHERLPLQPVLVDNLIRYINTKPVSRGNPLISGL